MIFKKAKRLPGLRTRGIKQCQNCACDLHRVAVHSSRHMCTGLTSLVGQDLIDYIGLQGDIFKADVHRAGQEWSRKLHTGIYWRRMLHYSVSTHGNSSRAALAD